MANHIEKRKRPLLIQPTTPEVKASWPSWRYHPKTGQGKVFQSEEEVPDNWVEHFHETAKGRGELEGVDRKLADDRSQSSGLSSDDGTELGAGEGTDGDEEPEELEDIEDLTVSVIKARLEKREVPFPANASKAKLYELLEENWEIEE